MEETLTLEELYLLLDAAHRKEEKANKFAAALQGVDLESNDTSKFDEVKRKADAMLSGKSEEELTFEQIGITFESDDD